MALSQKDIDNLKPKEKRYMLSVGEPKELYIRVYPTGKKVFYLRADKFKEFITLGQAQKGVLNVTNAREIAKEKLRAMIDGSFLGKAAQKFTLLNAHELYIAKYKSILAPATMNKKQLIFNKYMQSVQDKGINTLDKKDFLGVLDMMKAKGIDETLEKLIAHLCHCLELARQRGELKTQIISDLKDLAKFYKGRKEVKHHKAIIDEKELKHLLACLKDYASRKRSHFSAVNALYLTLLTAQRSKNIRLCKWADIDFENALWTIKASEMKVSSNGDNIVPLNEFAFKVLQRQRLFSARSEFVFASESKQGVISESFAVKFLKTYALKHTLHGFRATFRTQCGECEDALLKQGLSVQIAELILHHSKGDEVARAYDRAQAVRLRAKLMQWWGQRLNSLCAFEL